MGIFGDHFESTARAKEARGENAFIERGAANSLNGENTSILEDYFESKARSKEATGQEAFFERYTANQMKRARRDSEQNAISRRLREDLERAEKDERDSREYEIARQQLEQKVSAFNNMLTVAKSAGKLTPQEAEIIWDSWLILVSYLDGWRLDGLKSKLESDMLSLCDKTIERCFNEARWEKQARDDAMEARAAQDAEDWKLKKAKEKGKAEEERLRFIKVFCLITIPIQIWMLFRFGLKEVPGFLMGVYIAVIYAYKPARAIVALLIVLGIQMIFKGALGDGGVIMIVISAIGIFFVRSDHESEKSNIV